MAEPERITVTLSHDEWQWVLGLVMNSAYIRAKPIVEATEAAVRNAREVMQAAAVREQGERDDLRRTELNLRGELRVTEEVIDELRRENGRLARQVDGYKGKMSQMRKQRGNGHDAEALESLGEQLRMTKAALEAEALAHAQARRQIEIARAEWNAALGRPIGEDRPFPESPDAIEIEAELTEGADG